jgi:hypothetical protein
MTMTEKEELVKIKEKLIEIVSYWWDEMEEDGIEPGDRPDIKGMSLNKRDKLGIYA